MRGPVLPDPRFALGKGRQWDGIPLPSNLQYFYLWPGSHWDKRRRAKRLYDVVYEDGRFVALTDLSVCCEVSESRARELIFLLRSLGFEAKTVNELRAAQEKMLQTLRVLSQYRGELPEAAEPEVQKMCSPGEEVRILRRLKGADRQRSIRLRRLRSERRTRDDHEPS